jgi:hypothetical protein
MKKNYFIMSAISMLNVFIKKSNTFKCITILFILFFNDIQAQQTITLGDGVESINTLGISPFATINRNNRSQYIYFAEELYNAGFSISGNVIKLAVNVTELGLPSSLKPENIKIKMGMTTSFALGSTLVDDLPVYYESTVENITGTGWYTFNLNTPFAWDGFRNIIVEICRSNTNFGTSFSVQCKNFPAGERVSVANYTNNTTPVGCSLPNQNLLAELFARRRPNMQFTITNPCDATPVGGQTIVSAGPYCSGEAFTLSVQNGSVASGLSYQWQSSPNDNGPWTDILNATDAFYSATQSIATYYRRATTCDIVSSTVFDFPVFVGGEGCYCNSLVANENGIGITNVTIASINNSSLSIPTYSNFTSIQTELEKETTVPLSVNVSPEGGTNYTMAWIDWNQNSVFEVSESFVLGTVTGGNNINSGIIANVTVPVEALLGSTIMRVRTKQSETSTYPLPCESIANGEAEDYIVVIKENLNNDEFSSINDTVIISVSNSDIHFLAKQEGIQKIDLFDLCGRLIFSNSIANENEFKISGLNQKKQLLIAKIVLSNGQQITKKIVY